MTPLLLGLEINLGYMVSPLFPLNLFQPLGASPPDDMNKCVMIRVSSLEQLLTF